MPSDIGFRTKLDLTAEMLGGAAERGHLPYASVTADAAYGDSHDLRRLVAEQGRWYCFEVSRDAQVWTTDRRARSAWTTTRSPATAAGITTSRCR